MLRDLYLYFNSQHFPPFFYTQYHNIHSWDNRHYLLWQTEKRKTREKKIVLIYFPQIIQYRNRIKIWRRDRKKSEQTEEEIKKMKNYCLLKCVPWNTFPSQFGKFSWRNLTTTKRWKGIFFLCFLSLLLRSRFFTS